MESQIPKTHSDEQPNAENDREQPAAQWKKIFSGAWQDFSPKHLSNLIFLIVGLLLSPTVGYFMNKPKIMIGGSAFAVTILIWIFAYQMMKQAERLPSKPETAVDTVAQSGAQPTEHQNQPTVSAQSQPEPIPSTKPPGMALPPSPPQNAEPHQGTKPMSENKNDAPKQPPSTSNSITNSPIVNSPNSVQNVGGTVTINQGPQHRVITTEQHNAIAAVLKTHKPETVYVLIHGQEEPENYAEQIARAIEAGGWQAIVIGQSMIPVIYGVKCYSTDADVRGIISLAFQRAQIECIGINRRYDHPHAIVVGPQ